MRIVADKNQPAQKLHDATVHAMRTHTLVTQMPTLNIETSIPLLPRDRRVTYGARTARMKAEYIVLADILAISQTLNSTTNLAVKAPNGTPANLSQKYFNDGTNFIKDCNTENLPKLAVESTLYFTEIA
jgi:hypothetical protein